MVDSSTLLAAFITTVVGCVATAVASYFIPRVGFCIKWCFMRIWSGLKWCYFKIFPCFKFDKNDQQKDEKERLKKGLLTNDPRPSSSGGQAIHGHGLIFLAGDLTIEHRDNKRCWDWPVVLPNEPRFKEVAVLKSVSHLEIKATVNFSGLSPPADYAAFLIYKTNNDSDGLHRTQEAYVEVGKNQSLKKVCLEPTSDTPEDIEQPENWSDNHNWMQLKLGQFSCNNNVKGKAEIIIMETSDGIKKTGLIVAAIEIRPI